MEKETRIVRLFLSCGNILHYAEFTMMYELIRVRNGTLILVKFKSGIKTKGQS